MSRRVIRSIALVLSEKYVCLLARIKCTYGNMVRIEGMAETESITQNGRGDKSSVQIDIWISSPLNFSRASYVCRCYHCISKEV